MPGDERAVCPHGRHVQVSLVLSFRSVFLSPPLPVCHSENDLRQCGVLSWPGYLFMVFALHRSSATWVTLLVGLCCVSLAMRCRAVQCRLCCAVLTGLCCVGCC